jgi:flagellar biosynthetic protein FliQ
MEPQVVIDIMQDAFRTSLFLALPALTAAMVVGVIVAVFQTVTSIQEQTLAFVPKMLAVMLVLILFFGWMQRMVISFTTELISNLPKYIG